MAAELDCELAGLCEWWELPCRAGSSKPTGEPWRTQRNVTDFDRSSVQTLLARWSFDGGQCRSQSGEIVGTGRRSTDETTADLSVTEDEELDRKTDR